MNWNSFAGCIYSGDPKDQVATIKCLPAVFYNVISALIILGGAFAVYYIIYAGLKLIHSGGDPKEVEIGRKTLQYAFIGLIVVLGSFLLINLVAQVTGTNCITAYGFLKCR